MHVTPSHLGVIKKVLCCSDGGSAQEMIAVLAAKGIPFCVAVLAVRHLERLRSDSGVHLALENGALVVRSICCFLPAGQSRGGAFHAA